MQCAFRLDYVPRAAPAFGDALADAAHELVERLAREQVHLHSHQRRLVLKRPLHREGDLHAPPLVDAAAGHEAV